MTNFAELRREIKACQDEGFSSFHIDIEQAVLGAMLINADAASTILDIVSSRHFYDPVHARIYEAIATHKLTGSDDFYKRRVEQLKDKKDNRLLYDMFLGVTNSSYKTYKSFFPEYNEEKINYWLTTLKEFGPGTYCALVTVMLLCIKSSKSSSTGSSSF